MIGLIIMLVCCWGSAALFLGIGLWADHRATPMNFWAGMQIPEQCVSDIPSYNHANAGCGWCIPSHFGWRGYVPFSAIFWQAAFSSWRAFRGCCF